MKDVILLGAGASVKEGIEKALWSKIKGKEIWSMNSAFKTMPYNPSKELWVDNGFFKHEVANLQRLKTEGVELIAKTPSNMDIYAPFQDNITLYPTMREREFFNDACMKDMNFVFIGGHGFSGVFGLSVACKKEYERIFLLGYDWGSPKDIPQTHYYQDDIQTLKIRSQGAGHPNIYSCTDGQKFLKDFKIFEKEKSKIYNVSMISKIENFPKITYEDFFKMIEEQ